MQWDRPLGRIEAYDLKWNALDPIPLEMVNEDSESSYSTEPVKHRAELLSGEAVIERDVWDELVQVQIAPLMSGVAYSIVIGTTSHGMTGEVYTATIRTCKICFTPFINCSR